MLGIRSRVRDALSQGRTTNVVNYLTAWNVDVARSELKKDPEVAHLAKEGNFFLGPGRVAVLYNLQDGGDTLNIGLVSQGEDAGTEGEWFASADPDEVKQKFADFAPVLTKVLEKAKPEDFYVWRLSELPELPSWSSESGSLVLTGDAAHAMLPYAGMVSLAPSK